MMKPMSFMLCIAGLVLVVAGCAARQSEGRPMAAAPGSTQQETAQQAREVRSQSYALGEMADRRQREADVLAKELGPDHPSVEKKRRLAQELQDAADDADRQARDLRRSVPHGMVQ